jgi:hypothetical protein
MYTIRPRGLTARYLQEPCAGLAPPPRLFSYANASFPLPTARCQRSTTPPLTFFLTPGPKVGGERSERSPTAFFHSLLATRQRALYELIQESTHKKERIQCRQVVTVAGFHAVPCAWARLRRPAENCRRVRAARVIPLRSACARPIRAGQEHHCGHEPGGGSKA